MPTPRADVRLAPSLIDAARRKLGLPDDTPTSQVIRAALLRLTGDVHATGAAANRGGRPRKTTQ